VLTEAGEEWLAKQTEGKTAMVRPITQQGGQENTAKAIVDIVRRLHDDKTSQKYLLTDILVELNKLNPASFGASAPEIFILRGIFRERNESPAAISKKGIPGIEEVEAVMSKYQPSVSVIDDPEALTEESASRQVFIVHVHGHDEGKREATARLITKTTGIEPIILFEQPGGGALSSIS